MPIPWRINNKWGINSLDQDLNSGQPIRFPNTTIIILRSHLIIDIVVFLIVFCRFNLASINPFVYNKISYLIKKRFSLFSKKGVKLLIDSEKDKLR